MSAVLAEQPAEIDLPGSREMPRRLIVRRSSAGYFYVSVHPRGKQIVSLAFASSMSPARPPYILAQESDYRPTLFVGGGYFDITIPEKDRLVATFGFEVRP